MSTGMPRPLSTTVTESSACTVTLISSAWPAMASSTELSTTSQTRWCKPISPVEPIYIAGRRRTASRPPRTLIDFASYLWPPCGVPPTFSFSPAFSLSPMFSPGPATSRVYSRRWTDSAQFGVRVRVQNLFSVKQGRRACGLIRTSPHPVIPVPPGESETRRVPAPSHLAQRDVAKTHVSPGPCPRAPGAKLDFWVTWTWPTCRFEGELKPIDNPRIVLEPGLFLKQLKLERFYISCLFPAVYGFNLEARTCGRSLVSEVLMAWS